jgi:hypothetical protein
MKLTKDERALLEKLLAKAKQEDERLRTLGQYGALGGRIPIFPPCTTNKAYTTKAGKTRVRHRFKNGICACGVARDGVYRFEEIDGQRVWYVRLNSTEGDGWRRL